MISAETANNMKSDPVATKQGLQLRQNLTEIRSQCKPDRADSFSRDRRSAGCNQHCKRRMGRMVAGANRRMPGLSRRNRLLTTTAICGSDLHLYDGYIPTMEKGDILGHEFMGEVVEVGPAVERLKAGDRVVVPFTIACGRCFFCVRGMSSLCDNSNPNAWMLEQLYGQSTAGLF